MKAGTAPLFSPLASVAAIILGGLFVVAAWDSLAWPYVHDSPLMLYAGWYIGQGAAPYRDIFDMNMPGTYLAMRALGLVFGWTDSGFRVADLILTATIASGTYGAFRSAGRAPAIAAALLFPLWYLRAGPSTSMQREILALAPLSLLLALAESHVRPSWRALGGGALTGAAILIKPQFALLALPPLVRLAARAPSDQRIASVRGLAAGAAVPLAAAALFLAAKGSFGDFVDVATNYWPLYGQLNGFHQIMTGSERWSYLVTSTWDGLQNRYVVLAILGLACAFSSTSRRAMAAVWTGLVLAGAIYPALSGHFWDYHWLPLAYALLGAAALALAPPQFAMPAPLRLAQAGVAIAVVGAVAYASGSAVVAARGNDPRSDVTLSRDRVRGAPSEVAAFLQQHLVSGDRVQPLDWSGGAVHGMLMARAPLATRFMYDFHFYHHVDDPYIGRLRREFMRQMFTARPRFVIDVFAKRPYPTGPRTSTDFPELRLFLDEHYKVVHEAATFRIYESTARNPA